MVNKPNTQIAMRALIAEIRTEIPFDTPVERLCNGPCTGCAKKLLDYLDTQLEEIEADLLHEHIPTLGEINRLSKTARKIYAALNKNGLIFDNHA
ncbi:hypothetical protein Q4488_03100 [Amphritea sp. 1_MG-2023]|uniref:hypothetical protein n=1 Tax=Amphritea sp. 1_MG-2023 TaxID=3062670 RepID=UPI0026E3E3D8|nr:hypothetical protein [Amphritea sp. 1_MG-2023]MDO6562361.1 hypothetical protein [Amphritea sp. 1_MG-2023]